MRVESSRGAIEVAARVGQVMTGAVFACFPCGAWDPADLDNRPATDATTAVARQANELTMTVWDPVFKQPYFKTAACRVTKVRGGDGPSAAPTTAASAPVMAGSDETVLDRLPPRPGSGFSAHRVCPPSGRGSPMTQLPVYLSLVDRAEQALTDSFRVVAGAQSSHPDVYFTCQSLATMPDGHRSRLGPVATRYGEQQDSRDSEPERLHAEALEAARTGPVGLLRDLQDLQDLHLLANLVATSWAVIQQAARGLRDRELLDVATSSSEETARQIAWLTTRMKSVAPQALIVAS